MAENDVIEILIDLSHIDPALKAEELEAKTGNFCREIEEIVEDAEILRDQQPDKTKGLGALLPTIRTLVSASNIAKLIETIRYRFGAKPVELTGKKDGFEFSIKVGRPEDLDRAIDAFLRLAKV